MSRNRRSPRPQVKEFTGSGQRSPGPPWRLPNALSDFLIHPGSGRSGPLGSEQGAEVFYNFSVTHWFRIPADLQLIDPSRRAADIFAVAGLRAAIRF